MKGTDLSKEDISNNEGGDGANEITEEAAAYRVADIENVQQTDRTRYTANPDGILSEEAVRRIDFICDTLRTGGYAEVAVVAVLTWLKVQVQMQIKCPKL